MKILTDIMNEGAERKERIEVFQQLVWNQELDLSYDRIWPLIWTSMNPLKAYGKKTLLTLEMTGLSKRFPWL